MEPKTIEERVEALTMTMELMGHRMEDIERAFGKALETVNALTRLASIQNDRITRLEEGHAQT